ncbi:DUF680 domain-containing protein [Mesorhizobium sp. CU2]|uniref:DUF680 domain-containing protein n=1 Tax=unclassified Mesorhizobium TaxID=325217 RepID=UPI00112BE516|nr:MULTISPECIES: DUF680 domain-containing protein [unclassified Mesorhizobium]TPN78558.1 DUF680 domain-containing protein [Mesorhizobium sp. CU3]TPO15994.1 DUF680 domain-containing protein [Mesorhizobium sp. CU2]
MTKIALALATVLVASGAAFAGSDNYGSANADRPAAPVAANIDNSVTASIKKSDELVRKPMIPGSNRDLFGNR